MIGQTVVGALKAIFGLTRPSGALTYTPPAQTALTASTEFPKLNFDLSSNQQWATGALALQRFARWQKPTIAFVGASTVTTAATIQIDGAPAAGTNATLTESSALRVLAGAAAGKCVVLQTAASPTVSPFEVQNSTGTAMVDITSGFNFRLLNTASIPLILGSSAQGLGVGYGGAAMFTLLAGGYASAWPVTVTNAQVSAPAGQFTNHSSYTGVDIFRAGINGGNSLLAVNLVSSTTGDVIVKATAGFVKMTSAPTTLSADVNDWAPTRGSIFRTSTNDGTARNVTGLSFAQIDGQTLTIVNLGPGNLVLKHQSASSTAANRFLNSTAADITLSTDQAADLIYDSTTARWRVYKRN